MKRSMGDSILMQVPHDMSSALLVGAKRVGEWNRKSIVASRLFDNRNELRCWVAFIIAVGQDLMDDADVAFDGRGKGKAAAMRRVVDEVVTWKLGRKLNWVSVRLQNESFEGSNPSRPV